MDNQIYRIRMSTDKSLEIYICDTNELEPYRKVKEIGVVFIGKDLQIHGQLDLENLSSLINYLQNCKEYIDEYNETSNNKAVQK